MKNKITLLIVEDDPSLRKVWKIFFENMGYSVETAENGKQAIQKSTLKFYNIALVDIKLGDIEGTEVLTAMHKKWPKMVKIIATGYPSLKNAVKSLNYGAHAYLIKPFKPEKLLAIINEKLEEQYVLMRAEEALYQITSRGYLAILLDQIETENILEKTDETTIQELLLALKKALSSIEEQTSHQTKPENQVP